ncbi:MAG: IclR family transcriptional regulator [Kiloniellales bacterium]|nr:IclR family transcriptional regulator [Kiloniellales bacterium]
MKRDLSRSIKRTLEVLEYFDADRPTVTVNEISRALGYPQSSTSILLKSLAELGYLLYDKASRTYRPSARVALLGRGVQSYLFGDGSVMAALEEVNRRTGEMVTLAAPAGVVLQYIHVIPATNPVRLHLSAGTVRPMIGSAVGHLFLSARPDDQIDEEIERLASAQGKAAIGRDELMKEIRKIRRKGYVISTSTVTPGGGVVALLLPGLFNGTPLAVGIGGVASVITSNEQHFVAILREAVTRHIEPLLSRAG